MLCSWMTLLMSSEVYNEKKGVVFAYKLLKYHTWNCRYTVKAFMARIGNNMTMFRYITCRNGSDRKTLLQKVHYDLFKKSDPSYPNFKKGVVYDVVHSLRDETLLGYLNQTLDKDTKYDSIPLWLTMQLQWTEFDRLPVFDDFSFSCLDQMTIYRKNSTGFKKVFGDHDESFKEYIAWTKSGREAYSRKLKR